MFGMLDISTSALASRTRPCAATALDRVELSNSVSIDAGAGDNASDAACDAAPVAASA